MNKRARAVAILSARQRSDGGIGYWSSTDWSSAWLSAFAGMVLLDANEAAGDVKVDTLVLHKLAEYIASKYQTTRKERDLDNIYVADVLSIYVDDCGPRQRNRRKFDERIGRLNDFWGGKRLSEVNGESCRAYVRERGNLGGARRDLEDLRAGINHHANEGLHRSIVRVTLPEKGLARDRWLTRGEAARLGVRRLARRAGSRGLRDRLGHAR
jgi:hypothetical protein